MKKIALFLLLSITNVLSCMELDLSLPRANPDVGELFNFGYLDDVCPINDSQKIPCDEKQENHDSTYLDFLQYVHEKSNPQLQNQQLKLVNQHTPSIIEVPKDDDTPLNLSECLLCKIYKNQHLQLHENWHNNRAKQRCETCQLASYNKKFSQQHTTTQFHKTGVSDLIKRFSTTTGKIDTTEKKEKQTKKRKLTHSSDEEYEFIDDNESDESDEFDSSDETFICKKIGDKNNNSKKRSLRLKKTKISDEEYELSDEISESSEEYDSDNYSDNQDEASIFDLDKTSFRTEHNLKKCNIGNCIYTDIHGYNLSVHKKCQHGHYPCSDCGIETGSLGALIQHMRNNHTELKQCDRCIYVDKHGYNWKKHNECDHGHYPCIFCGIETGSSGALLQHVRDKHKGQKKCPKCLYIATFNNYGAHQKTKHGPHPCYFCGTETGSNGGLMQHLSKMHEDLTQCSLCSKEFETTRQLHGHMWLRHKKMKNK